MGPVPSQPGAENLRIFLKYSNQSKRPQFDRTKYLFFFFSQSQSPSQSWSHETILAFLLLQNREDPEGEDHGVATPTLNALEPLLHHRPQTVPAQAGAERRAGHGRGPPPRAAEPLGRLQGSCQDHASIRSVHFNALRTVTSHSVQNSLGSCTEQK